MTLKSRRSLRGLAFEIGVAAVEDVRHNLESPGLFQISLAHGFEEGALRELEVLLRSGGALDH